MHFARKRVDERARGGYPFPLPSFSYWPAPTAQGDAARDWVFFAVREILVGVPKILFFVIALLYSSVSCRELFPFGVTVVSVLLHSLLKAVHAMPIGFRWRVWALLLLKDDMVPAERGMYAGFSETGVYVAAQTPARQAAKPRSPAALPARQRRRKLTSGLRLSAVRLQVPAYEVRLPRVKVVSTVRVLRRIMRVVRIVLLGLAAMPFVQLVVLVIAVADKRNELATMVLEACIEETRGTGLQMILATSVYDVISLPLFVAFCAVYSHRAVSRAKEHHSLDSIVHWAILYTPSLSLNFDYENHAVVAGSV